MQEHDLDRGALLIVVRRSENLADAEREHERILASYGGAYDDPRLEALIGKTVDRLVAASDRPDLAYKVTILNSGAVNAFALPTGQLYVTRGLVALASDTSELSSVLSHEMAHVLAKHASIREDQARQAAIVSRVINDVLSDPQTGALALAKSKIALASFSRAQEFEADGIGVGIAARAGFDPRALATPYRWFRISPRRIQAWREANELPGRELMRARQVRVGVGQLLQGDRGERLAPRAVRRADHRTGRARAAGRRRRRRRSPGRR